MWIFDLESLRFVDVNQAALAVYGYTREEFLARTILDCHLPEDRGTVRDHIAGLAPKAATQTDWHHLAADGRILHVQLAGEGIDYNGRPSRLIALVNVTEAERARESLEESEARYRALIEHAPDAIVVLDAETGRFAEANANACELFGLSREQLLTTGPVEVSPETQPGGQPSAAVAREAISEALKGATPVFEYTHLHSSGRAVTCEVRLVRLPGNRPLIRGSITDIGERKEVEHQILRREREFRSLAENSPDMIVRFNRDLQRIYVNEAVSRASGVPPEALVGKRPTESFPGMRVMQEWEEGVAETFRTGAPQLVDAHADLTAVDNFLQTHLIPEFGPDGSVETVLSITRDLTEVRRAIEAQSRLGAIVESSQDGMIVVDRDSRIVTWNRGAERIFGYSVDEVVGQSTDMFFASDEGAVRDNIRERVLVAGESIENLERTWRRKDGSHVTCFSSYFPVRDASGAIVGIGSVARDVSDLRQAREELARVAAIVESANDAMMSTDLTGRIVSWNAGAERMFGYSADEAIGNTTATIFGADEELRAQIRGHVLQDGETLQLSEREWPTRSGGRVTTSTSFFPIRDSFGRITGLGGVARDGTERKAAEAALRESEERFRTLADSAPMLIWLSGPDAEVEFFNMGWRRYTGRMDDQDLGQGWVEVIHPDDLEATIEGYRENFEKRQDYSLRYRLRRHDGEYRWILEYGAPRFNAAGDFLGFSGACVDIHESMLAEESLRENEARFRNVVEGTPDLITRYDADLRFEFGNGAALRAMDSVQRQPNGKRIDEMGLQEDFAALWLGQLTTARDTGEPVEFEYETPSSYGRWWRRARIVPEKDAAGKVHHLLCVVTDTTLVKQAEEERRRLDQQMQQTQKLESLGILAGGIAHDFNNLLVAILGNAGLALMELPPESAARQTVQAIETAAQRAAELTRQMLAYSGKGKFVIESLNLSRLVEEMAHLLEVSVSKRATLKYRFASDLPLIEGDATQVRQVIMNLITNASDAIGDGSGVISISTGVLHADRSYLASSYLDADLPEGDYVYVEVTDTGAGMDDATRARIFDPFFTTKFTGRGLGLAAVLGIVRGHSGAIKVYSEPGRGTTFKVLFPAITRLELPPEAPIVPETAVAAPSEPAGGTVLVVDDDETVRSVTRRMLEHSGYTVVLASDGVEALKLYAATPAITVVLLDMTMPHMDGEETFRELRRLSPDVRVVLTSGYNEQDATERFVGKGLAGFIQKPYRPAELIAKIREVLGP